MLLPVPLRAITVAIMLLFVSLFFVAVTDAKPLTNDYDYKFVDNDMTDLGVAIDAVSVSPHRQLQKEQPQHKSQHKAHHHRKHPKELDMTKTNRLGKLRKWTYDRIDEDGFF